MDSKKQEQKGQGLIEYALIMVLVVLVGMIALFFFGPAVRTTYAQVVCEMEGVSGDPGCYYMLPDQSSVGGGSAVVVWKEAPGALRYEIETRTLTCHQIGCSTFRGGAWKAEEVCQGGICRATIAPWSAGRYVTIRAYGSKGSRVETGVIPAP